jgi:hypothetical protein
MENQMKVYTSVAMKKQKLREAVNRQSPNLNIYHPSASIQPCNTDPTISSTSELTKEQRHSALAHHSRRLSVLDQVVKRSTQKYERANDKSMKSIPLRPLDKRGDERKLRPFK